MKENLMNPAHKATNKSYRENYDAIFKKGGKDEGNDSKKTEKGRRV